MHLLSLYLPGIIVSFREGLEAFLIIIVLLSFLEKTGNNSLKKNIWIGWWLGIFISIWVGWFFFWISHFLRSDKGIGKIWESSLSLIAVVLIISFVIWMIQNGQHIKKHIEKEANSHLSQWGLILITTLFIAREGVEISVFAYAGEYPWQGIVMGVILAIIVALSTTKLLVRAKLTTLLTITLFYLIIQCGYLFGYSLHEWLSALKELNIARSESWVFTKVFNLSGSLLDHKEGVLWFPLNILFGWYSKPEWIQFIWQYLCTWSLFWMWRQTRVTTR